LTSDGVHFVTTTGGGSLVTIDFPIQPTAPAGASSIDLRFSNTSPTFVTRVVDQTAAGTSAFYTLSPAPVSGADPNDGSITVTAPATAAPNTPPWAVNDNSSVPQDTVLNVPAPGVLANDTDPAPGDPRTASLLTQPSHGTVTNFQTNGSFTYTPTTGYHGPD